MRRAIGWRRLSLRNRYGYTSASYASFTQGEVSNHSSDGEPEAEDGKPKIRVLQEQLDRMQKENESADPTSGKKKNDWFISGDSDDKPTEPDGYKRKACQ